MDIFIEKAVEFILDKCGENKTFLLFVVILGIIFILPHFLDAFYMTKVELLIANKNEEYKKKLTTVLSIFFVFFFCNFFLALDLIFIIVELVFAVPLLLYFLFLKIFQAKILIKGDEKGPVSWVKRKIKNSNIEDIELMMYIVSFPILIIGVNYGLDAGIILCCLVGTLVEVILLIFRYPETIRKKMGFSIELEDQSRWYIYQLTEDKQYLCGDHPDIDKAEEVRFISLDSIREKGYRIVKS